MNLYKFIISCIISIFVTFNISYAIEEYDKCIEEKTKEAGEDMDYVYKAVIIQLCKNETEDQNDN
tara:strand:- start:34989 stop:35183 length:195 start_codon:yes stop_codon:yes gene_type:complete